MYRVLIADDEPWVAYGISKIIDWEKEGFEIIGETYDGLAALTAIRKQKPDAVISDIRMPGLDGIQLMDALRKECIDTEVIIVSGYAEFDYAKKAIYLGAFDYLLKQINKNELLTAVRRLRSRLDEKMRMHMKSVDRIEELFDLLESDQSISVQQFMLERREDATFPNYRFISCLCSDTVLMARAMKAALSREGMPVLCFRTGQHKLSFLINYDERYDAQCTAGFAESCLEHCSGAGVSSPGETDSPVSKLYQESDIALLSRFSMPRARIIEYKDTAIPGEVSKMILNMEAAIKEHKPESIGEMLDRLATSCVQHSLYIDRIADVYNHIVSLIFKYYPHRFGYGMIEFLTYDHIARVYANPGQLFNSLNPLFEAPADTEGAISNEQVRKILEYIDERLTEDLSLGGMAKQLNMSIGYLSLLFKRETGITYSDYVTRKRLDLAKELLSNGALSIQEVAERTGYKDYYHFNKLFKKHIGVTPSKFRKL